MTPTKTDDPNFCFALDSMYDLVWPHWISGIPDISPLPSNLLFDNFIDAMQEVWERSQNLDQEDMQEGPTEDFIDVVGQVFMELDLKGLQAITKIFKAIQKDFVAVRFFNPSNPKEVYIRATPRTLAKNLIAISRDHLSKALVEPVDIKRALAPVEEAVKKEKAPAAKAPPKKEIPAKDTSGVEDEDDESDLVPVPEPTVEEQASGLPSVNFCQKYYSTDPLYTKNEKFKGARFRCAGDYLANDGSRCKFAEANKDQSAHTKGAICAYKQRNDKVPATNPMAWLCTCTKAQKKCTEKFEVKNGQAIISEVAQAKVA